jgi:FixJ family two-component response regulator
MVSRPAIAIIDDDVLVRESVRRLVRSLGYEAELFASPEEFISSGMPEIDAIISDVIMADGRSTDLQQSLASTGQAIPIIFMTARPDPYVVESLMRAGAIRVLIKPFHQKDMATCISVALQKAGAPVATDSLPPAA